MGKLNGFETNVREKKKRREGFKQREKALEFDEIKKLSDERSMDMKLRSLLRYILQISKMS